MQEQGRSEPSLARAPCPSPSTRLFRTLPSPARPLTATQAAQVDPPSGAPSPRSDVHPSTRLPGVCLPVCSARCGTVRLAHERKDLQGALGVGGQVRETRLAQQPARVGRPSASRGTTAIARDRRTPGHTLTVLSASCVTLGSHAPLCLSFPFWRGGGQQHLPQGVLGG